MRASDPGSSGCSGFPVPLAGLDDQLQSIDSHDLQRTACRNFGAGAPRRPGLALRVGNSTRRDQGLGHAPGANQGDHRHRLAPAAGAWPATRERCRRRRQATARPRRQQPRADRDPIASSSGFTPVHSAKAPSTIEITPPTVSRPNEVTSAPARSSPMPSRISSSPPTFSGRLFEPMKASTSAIAPGGPVKKFGWNSSAEDAVEADGEQDEGDVRVGEQVQEALADVHAHVADRQAGQLAAAAGPRTRRRGRRPAGRESICGEQVAHRRWRRGPPPAAPWPPHRRPRRWPRRAPPTRPSRHCGRGASARSLDHGRVRVVDLLRQRVGQVRAPAADHGGGANGRRWRHGGHVAGEGDEGGGAAGLGAFGRHVGDHREAGCPGWPAGSDPCWSARRPASRSRSATAAAPPSAAAGQPLLDVGGVDLVDDALAAGAARRGRPPRRRVSPARACPGGARRTPRARRSATMARVYASPRSRARSTSPSSSAATSCDHVSSLDHAAATSAGLAIRPVCFSVSRIRTGRLRQRR